MKILVFLSIFFFFNLYALDIIDINATPVSILEHSDIYLNKKHLSIKEIEKKRLFKPYKKNIYNNGESRNIVWVKFKLKNGTNKKITKTLEIKSPTIANIYLYKGLNSTPKTHGSLSKINHFSIHYFFNITLDANCTNTYYLKIYSDYKSFFFSLYLGDLENFLVQDIKTLSIRLIFIGLLLGLMIYFFMLAFYTKDRSYFYYAMYLFFLLWHQIAFVGLIKLYFPMWFILFDLKFTVPKLGFILIFAILFAITFLKIKKDTLIFKIYTIFLLIGVLTIFNLIPLKLALIIGVFFVFFNFFSGVYSYLNGVKQARLFIVGFGVVSVAYIIVILDTFGVTSLILSKLSILMWATTIEVLVLSLAFADRYQILQEEKEQILKNRQKDIKKEVERKTKDLNQALKEKELLLQEVHHRVKNNLQVILSILKLQGLKIDDIKTQEELKKLENRINAIFKSYNMLIATKHIEAINMRRYIKALIKDIQYSMSIQEVDIELDVDLRLPLKKAVYIGIILNELITNSFKYAFRDNKGKIYIKLHKKGDKNILIYKDSGEGFELDKQKSSLGLTIINILVLDQLEGDIKITTKPLEYIIIF